MILIYDRREQSGNMLLDAFKKKGIEACICRDADSLPFGQSFDVLVTEIRNNDSLLEALRRDNPQLRLLLFSDFSRDSFIENLYHAGLDVMMRGSYKVRDIIQMTQNAKFDRDPKRVFGLEKYFPGVVGAISHEGAGGYVGKEYKEGLEGNEDKGLAKSTFQDQGLDQNQISHITKRQYHDHELSISSRVFREASQYFKDHNLQQKIENYDLLELSIAELIDNNLQAQIKESVPRYEIYLEIAHDSEKVGLTIYNNQCPVNKEALYNSLNRKMKKNNKMTEDESSEYVGGKYLGYQGRGFFIIQQGVHQLSMVLLDPIQAKKYNMQSPRCESTILVYLQKNKDSANSKSKQVRKNSYMVLSL